MGKIVDLEQERAKRMREPTWGYVEDGQVVLQFEGGGRVLMSAAAAETWANGLLELAKSARAEGKER